LVGSILDRSCEKIAHFDAIVIKHGGHRHILFSYWLISKKSSPRKPHLAKSIYKSSSIKIAHFVLIR
jgi:hypothetical protein